MKAAKKEEKKAKMEVETIQEDKAKAMSAAKKEMAKARKAHEDQDVVVGGTAYVEPDSAASSDADETWENGSN